MLKCALLFFVYSVFPICWWCWNSLPTHTFRKNKTITILKGPSIFASGLVSGGWAIFMSELFMHRSFFWSETVRKLRLIGRRGAGPTFTINRPCGCLTKFCNFWSATRGGLDQSTASISMSKETIQYASVAGGRDTVHLHTPYTYCRL